MSNCCCPPISSPQTPIMVIDTASVNLTATGIYNHTLQADVNISEDADNAIEIRADGLYAPDASVITCETVMTCISEEDCNDLTDNNGLFVTVDHTHGAREVAATMEGPLIVDSTPVILLTTGTVTVESTECRLSTVGFVISGDVKCDAPSGRTFTMEIQIQKNADGWGPASLFQLGAGADWDGSYIIADTGTVTGPAAGAAPDTYQLRLIVSTDGPNVEVFSAKLKLMMFFGTEL